MKCSKCGSPMTGGKCPNCAKGGGGAKGAKTMPPKKAGWQKMAANMMQG